MRFCLYLLKKTIITIVIIIIIIIIINVNIIIIIIIIIIIHNLFQDDKCVTIHNKEITVISPQYV